MVEQALRRAEQALTHFPLLGARLTPIEVGLINLTYRVDTQVGLQFALQRLNPIFGAQVNEDIDRVTQHLEARGLCTPKLLRTVKGQAWAELEGEIWRVLTWIQGENLSRADSPARTRAAGHLLGRFHAALQDFSAPFENTRLGVHDTPRHLAALQSALQQHADHRLFDEVGPLAQSILLDAEAVGALPDLPDRVVHGDPKLNNIIFDAQTGQGRCLIDLDTVARMPIVLELGDALRSWCNPAGENQLPPSFDLRLFEGALEGYAEGAEGLLTPDERDAIVPATATIMLELAARFAADALQERYFGWDGRHFASRGDHNLLRAKVQWGLAAELLGHRPEAEALLRQRLSA